MSLAPEHSEVIAIFLAEMFAARAANVLLQCGSLIEAASLGPSDQKDILNDNELLSAVVCAGSGVRDIGADGAIRLARHVRARYGKDLAV